MIMNTTTTALEECRIMNSGEAILFTGSTRLGSLLLTSKPRTNLKKMIGLLTIANGHTCRVIDWTFTSTDGQLPALVIS